MDKRQSMNSENSFIHLDSMTPLYVLMVLMMVVIAGSQALECSSQLQRDINWT